MAVQWIMDIFYGIIFLSPAFFANATPIFVSGLGRIDRGKNFFDGKPILGSHKTFGGLIGGILAGGMLGIIAPMFFPEIFYNSDVVGYTWGIGFVQGFGALFGDAFGSFVKRRFALKPGGPFPIMDQVGFVIFASIFTAFFVQFPLVWSLLVIPLTLIIHLSANITAYVFGWKDVWY